MVGPVVESLSEEVGEGLCLKVCVELHQQTGTVVADAQGEVAGSDAVVVL